jgi:hypothetical protein
MLISADQLLAHAIGDYLTQSHWMAMNKTKPGWAGVFACFAHVILYAIPFLILTSPSLLALLLIVGSHFAIDTFRMARFVVFAKNFLAPPSEWPVWADAKATGYPSDAPPWLSVWLLIIADNCLHILLNGLALKYL